MPFPDSWNKERLTCYSMTYSSKTILWTVLFAIMEAGYKINAFRTHFKMNLLKIERIKVGTFQNTPLQRAAFQDLFYVKIWLIHDFA